MDPELNTLLRALMEGQVKLAEGQVKLAEGQAKTDAALARLADQVGKLTSEVTRLGVRLDGFSEVVIRGFTDVAGTQGEFRARFERLDERVTELEKHQHP